MASARSSQLRPRLQTDEKLHTLYMSDTLYDATLSLAVFRRALDSHTEIPLRFREKPQ